MLPRDILIDLYIKKNKSMQEIADFFQCSLHKVQYWLSKYKVKIRSRSEALYAKHNPNGDPFFLKTRFNQQELILLGLGLGLWWGEGSKRHEGTIRLGNTDPQLIKKFIEFLQQICGVPMSKFRFGLQIFSDMDPKSAKQFWVKELNILPEQIFPKIVVTESGSIGTYRFKNQQGVLTVHCANIKLRKILDDLMVKYVGASNPFVSSKH